MKRADLVGRKFGKLTVASKAKSIAGGITVKRFWGAWNCLCDCGNTVIVKTVDLKRGAVKSCGCLKGEFGYAHKPGQKFGRLTTVSYNNGIWNCICDCGEYKKVTTNGLTQGTTQSCGCLKKEVNSKNSDKLIAGRRKYEPRIASARRVWKRYLYSDKDMTITFEEFLVVSQQNCFYCGIEPSNKYNYFARDSSNSSINARQNGLFIYNGMDRIDSDKAHTFENVVSSCYICNRSKSDRLTETFYQWISQLQINNFNPIIILNIIFPSRPLSTSIKSIFDGYKEDTDMTVEEFYSISQMNCFYCNNTPSNFFARSHSDKKDSKKTKKESSFYYNGLDRIDRSMPHNKNNVVPCCYSCNWAKMGLPLSEFNDWIKRIKTFQENKQY
jgi:hypothetical protein